MQASDDNRPTARSKGRPSVEEAAGIDRAILDAALEVLFRHGEAATLNEVARTAGLSRKTVYARYPGKSELFVSAIRQSLQAAGPVQYAGADSFRERLANFLTAVVRLVTGPNAMRFQRVLSINPDYIADLKPQLQEASRALIHGPLVALLREATAKGEIALDDPEGIAMIITFAAITPRFHSDLSNEAWPSDDQIAAYVRQLTDLLADGLLPR
ncbi:MAG: TetR/AcrR family transcriptional regulator [Sphingomonadales bacterium]|nr:TetR/AcrR family transcriptional regulator [Sphingomonadales bacterium]